jgi:snRNA-activating protein complex subunit 3
MQDPRAELRDEEPAALQMPSFEALTRVVARLRKRLEGERAVSRPRTEYNTRSPSLIAEHIRRVESLGDGGAQMLREDEVLLRVAIYHPTKGYRTQELVVTGTQTLANLRDAICCSVVLGLGEWRDSAVDPVAAASAQEARSGGPRELSFRVVDSAAFRVCSDFFFIEGVAFEDVRGTRHSAAQQLREWLCGSARSKEPRFMEPGLCDFAVEPMDRHSLEELRLRVGAQYLYQHAGGCNHVLVFTEATVGAPRDSRCRAAYPLPLFEAKVHMHACDMCSVSVAALVVHMDEFAAKTPAFFCDACFRLFNRGRAAPPRQLLFKPASEGGLAPVDGFSA